MTVIAQRVLLLSRHVLWVNIRQPGHRCALLVQREPTAHQRGPILALRAPLGPSALHRDSAVFWLVLPERILAPVQLVAATVRQAGFRRLVPRAHARLARQATIAQQLGLHRPRAPVRLASTRLPAPLRAATVALAPASPAPGTVRA